MTKNGNDCTILNVGSGSSTLIDTLVEEDFSTVIANDLAEKSLASLKNRVEENSIILFLVDDLLNPSKLNELKNIDLWNDRAVLYLFLKEEEITTYFNVLKKVLKPNGFVIIAVFAEYGAEKRCGLPLKRYSLEMFQKKIGVNFELKKSFNDKYTSSFGGKKPYVYELFQRKN